MKKMLMAAALIGASNLCVAEGFYIGADYLMLDTDLKAYGEKASAEPTALSVKFGGEFNRYFAAEAMLGIGLRDDTIKDADFDFELDLLIGVSAIGIIPVSDVVKLYGKLGLAKIEYNDSDEDPSDANGLLYGVGASFDFNSNYGMNLEYIRYPDGEYDDYDVDIETASINLGVYKRF